jgi:hypothetical protein
MQKANIHYLGESVCERIKQEQEEQKKQADSQTNYLPWIVAGGLALLLIAK